LLELSRLKKLLGSKDLRKYKLMLLTDEGKKSVPNFSTCKK